MRHLAKQRDASFFVLFFKTCQYGVLTNRLELLYGYQKTEFGLKVYADMHHVNQNTMTRWIRQFLLHGLAGVRHRSFNHRYSLNTKIEAVKEYQAGFPGEKIIEKYDILSLIHI